MISEPLLEKFQKLFKEKYQQEMTRQELVNAVDGFVGFFENLAKMNFEQKQQAENNKQNADTHQN